MRLGPGDRLVLATHNKGKLEEISRLLEPFGVRVVSAGDLGLPEPAETEATFVGNARIKAHASAAVSGLPALADDSGLCVEALGGAPGVYTADWATTETGRDFDQGMRRVWDALRAAKAAEPWRAAFHCTLVLAWPDGSDRVFEGSMQGRLIWPPRGDQGHGFDPMFVPVGQEITCGEMDRWEKNEVSHRADAFRKLVTECFA